VFTPTYASFLNRIECHFWAIGEFVVNNADYPDWNTFKKAMADHIQYRNGPHRDQRLIKAERRLPSDRRLTDEVSGATFLGDPLAGYAATAKSPRELVTNLSRTFAVVCWILASTAPWPP